MVLYTCSLEALNNFIQAPKIILFKCTCVHYAGTDGKLLVVVHTNWSYLPFLPVAKTYIPVTMC